MTNIKPQIKIVLPIVLIAHGNEEAYAAFTYDENGIRTSEQSIEDSLTFDFTTEDGAITGRQSADGKNYRFIYDESGKPTAFLMNGALYHYITNQMGDVVGVTDADGNLALEYFYDAWGDNFTRAIDQCDFDGEEGGLGAYKLSNANPLTYRGYYFDHAIGMYYLQSRYMNPVVNRFFNADDPDIARESKDLAVGMNLFAYCNNDPVNHVDPTGYKYSPSKAKAYAEKWWNPDKVGYNRLYGRVSQGDCTNFVSACLYAGGLSKMTGAGRKGWHCYATFLQQGRNQVYAQYQRSHAWAAAHNLFIWLNDTNHVKTTYIIYGAKDINRCLAKLYGMPLCSAAIFFDNTYNGNVNHAALSGVIQRTYNKKTKKYTYDMCYYAHSNPRNGKNMKFGLRAYFSRYNHAIMYVCVKVIWGDKSEKE